MGIVTHLREVALRKSKLRVLSLAPTPTPGSSRTQGTSTHVDVSIEVPNRPRLDLHALQAVTLEFRRRLHSVSDRALDDGDEHPRADERVRPERHEHVRELVHAHREVRRGIWFPLLVQVNAVPSDDRERQLPGGVIPCDAGSLAGCGQMDEVYY